MTYRAIIDQAYRLVLFSVIATVVLIAPSIAQAQQAHWEALNKQLSDLYNTGHYQQALPVAQEALKVAESTFGTSHFNVASSANNLAEIYRMLGRLASLPEDIGK